MNPCNVLKERKWRQHPSEPLKGWVKLHFCEGFLYKSCPTTLYAGCPYTFSDFLHKVMCRYCYVLYIWTVKVQRAQSSRRKFIYKLEKGKVQNWSELRLKSGQSEMSIHFLQEYLIHFSLGDLVHSIALNTIYRLVILKLYLQLRPYPWALDSCIQCLIWHLYLDASKASLT